MTYTPDPMQPGPQATKPNRGWIKWVVLGCFLALLLVAAIVVVIPAGLFWTFQKATAGPEATIQGFLAATAAGDYQTAHDYFSAPLKQVQPYEQFAAEAAANSSFFAVTDTTFNKRSVDMSGAELSGSVTLESGTVVPAQFKLVRENDDWKLISYNIGS